MDSRYHPSNSLWSPDEAWREYRASKMPWHDWMLANKARLSNRAVEHCVKNERAFEAEYGGLHPK